MFSHPTTARETRLVGWNPIVGTNTIIHVDGSSRGNPGDAGFGVVLRRLDGTWICGVSGYIGQATNLEAELHAILPGLRCIREL